MSTNEDSSPAYVDQETQTIIRVQPHILENITDFAEIKSDKKTQTIVSMKASEDTSKFYSLLRYTPYQDIKEDSIRIIELPRKIHLTFSIENRTRSVGNLARMFSLADDDGVGDICSEVLRRLESKTSVFLVDAEAQTDVKVSPHVLEEQRIASVFSNSGSQTPMGCSRRKSSR